MIRCVFMDNVKDTLHYDNISNDNLRKHIDDEGTIVYENIQI
jgi:hypothetical protein